MFILMCVCSAVKYYFKCVVDFEREVPVWHYVAYYSTILRAACHLFIRTPPPSQPHRIFAKQHWSFYESWIGVERKTNSESVSIGVFRPTAGSSFIPSPAEIAKKKAIVNIRNHNDNKCFQYSILAQLRPSN